MKLLGSSNSEMRHAELWDPLTGKAEWLEARNGFCLYRG